MPNINYLPICINSLLFSDSFRKIIKMLVLAIFCSAKLFGFEIFVVEQQGANVAFML